MNMPAFSVIICTHNPRPDYLRRVLDALKAQTLPKEQWELLIIDNGSKERLAGAWDLSWHPGVRHVREDELGLTPARLRGIKESVGELLMFVDDDNVLRTDYLAVALQTMRENPLIGVLGAGRILPEFEVEPAPETRPFLNSLALRCEPRALYSNEITVRTRALPYGAGLCIRRRFAFLYLDSCATRAMGTSLDRKGNDLLSGGDIDLALHACREGCIAAVLPSLEVMHLIPAIRLEGDYLVRLAKGHAVADYHLARLWNWNAGDSENPVIKRLRHWKVRFRLKGLARKIFGAESKGVEEARKCWR